MSATLALLISLSLLIPFPCEGKLLPWKVGDPFPYRAPEVKSARAEVEVSSAGDLFEYRYALVSSHPASIPITGFGLDLRVETGRHPYAFTDLSLSHSRAAHNRIVYSAPQVPIIQKKYPSGWETGRGVISVGRWSALGDNGAWLRPGHSVTGFVLVSTCPPGIRTFVADGTDTRWDPFYLGRSSEERSRYGPAFRLEFNKGLEFAGRTIAPAPPPETNKGWIAVLADNLAISREIGWVRSDLTAKTIRNGVSAIDAADDTRFLAGIRDLQNLLHTDDIARDLAPEAATLFEMDIGFVLNRYRSPPR